jgi:hypothetical protein
MTRATRVIRMSLTIAAVIVATLALAGVGRAQGEFEASPIAISVTGPASSTQTATFSVTSAAKRALAAAVVGSPPEERRALDPSVVIVTPDRASIVPGLPQVFRVVVQLPDEVDEYSARITVTVVPDPAAGATPTFFETLAVDLTATVLEAPSPPPMPAPPAKLAPVGSMTATRVSCNPFVECEIARFLLSDAVVSKTVTVVVQNPGSVDATPSQHAFLAVGDRSNTVLTESQVPLTAAEKVAAGKLGKLTYTLPDRPAADHYAGQLSVSLAGVPDPVTVPVDLTIRQGPFWPAVLLVVGLLLGLALRQGRKTVVPTGAAVERVVRVRRRISETLLSRHEWGALNERLNEAWSDVRAGKVDAANASMDGIEDSVALFGQFEALEVSLGDRTDDAAKAARAKIIEGRTKIAVGDAGAADLQGARQSLQQAAADAARQPARAARSAGQMEAIPAAEHELRVMTPVSENVPERQAIGWTREVRRLSFAVRAVTAMAALVTGMYLLYVVPGATFIGTGFADTVSLLLWGVGSGFVDKLFVNWD